MRANDGHGIVLGLTGGIACGKSRAAQMLQGLGAFIIDADAISKELTAEGGAALPQIREVFGDGVFCEDGTLNRAALANIVFHDIEMRRRLEGILHPAVQKETLHRMDVARDENAELIVLDVPLLFETGMDALCDVVWVVTVPYETQIARIMERDHKTRSQAEARIAAQMPLADKEKMATRVIPTDRPEEETDREIQNLYKDLLRRR